MGEYPDSARPVSFAFSFDLTSIFWRAMDKHPIETWDQLVHSMLHPAILLQSAPDAIDGYLVTAKELKEALRMQLLHDTLYNKTEAETGLLVERYQSICANLLDLLFHYQHYESITCELKQFYQEVAALLEAIIVLLQNAYGHYFNTALHLPLPLRLRDGRDLNRCWKIIAGTLNRSTSNTAIVNILDQCIDKLLHYSDGTAVTYHQASYFKNLLTELSGYLSTTASPPVYSSVTELLISWNFNEFAFIQQVCTGIRTEAENKESDEFRLAFLKKTQKQVSQLLEKRNAAFHSSQPTAKQTVLEWIEQELTCLEETAMAPEKKEVKEGIKIHTSISVPSLALITRLLKESGIVTNTNNTEILKFFATHFTTLRKSEFSYGHLHSKYYDADESTKKKVYDYLMVMANLCKKM